MPPTDLKAILKGHLPGLVVGEPDFILDREKSKVDFFCNTTSTLDYTVSLKAFAPTPGAVTMLVRETDSLNASLLAALKASGDAKISYCLMEDELSRGSLLRWSQRSAPLASRPAKVSYTLCALLLLLGAFLIYVVHQQPASPDRQIDVMSLALALGLPALSLPLPFVFEQLRDRGIGRWVFVGGEDD